MSKLHLDTLCWQWAETTDPASIDETHMKTAYRLQLKPCKPRACRRNCKGNPYCVSAIGERAWLSQIEDSAWHDITDPVLERRKADSFVGLKNLGATCYVNTFLQVWFHNLEFRSAIYRCNEVEEDGSADSSQSICAQLQLVFALLQFSQRQYVDPTPLIASLGLDTAQQQDAQEFSKLFMSLLEETLRQRASSVDTDLIQKQFQGHYSYVTRCGTCQARSLRQSTFYELDLNIKGHQHLRECIEEFLKEECLDGDNSYMCSVCECKRTATRSIQLTSLPPVLHLQLLRFVFDRRTGNKRKLNTYIQFPEKLNMAPYLQNANTATSDGMPTDIWYELVAVLIHNGASAHSGHYVAQIRDAVTNTWYRFNDETIECMNPGRKVVHLGMEDSDGDFIAKGTAKVPHLSKGEHGSRNAYMLVYRHIKQGETTEAAPASSISFSQLPQHVQRKVQEDNTMFDTWTRDLITMREERVQQGRARQLEVSHLHSILPATPGEPCEWVSMAWLQKYMGCETTKQVPAVDNASLLCTHHRLDPDGITSTRCISQQAADFIYDHYKGGPRLYRDMMCWQCVGERCRRINTKARISRDSKLIASTLKSNTPLVRDDCFWVSKTSLRSWKRMALEQLQHETELSSANSTAKPHQTEHQSSDAETLNVAESVEKCHRVDELSGVMSVDTNGSDKFHRGEVTSLGTNSAGSVQPSTEISGVPSGVNKHHQGACQSDVASSCDTVQQEAGELKEVLSEKVNKVQNSDSRDAQLASSGGENGFDKEEEEENTAFNEELLCEHGDLCVEESCRRLVPAELWTRLHNYFPMAPEFRGNAQPCSKCYAALLALRARQEEERVARATQRSMLTDLYLDRHRPLWRSDKINQLWVLPMLFLQAWKNFIKGTRDGQVTTVGTEALLCQHGRLPYQPETIGMKGDSDSMVYIWPEEWKLIQSFTDAEMGICISCVKEESGHVTFLSSPDVCEECCANRLNAEYQYRLNYENATIFVRKVDNEKATKTELKVSDENTDDTCITQLGAKRKLPTPGQGESEMKTVRVEPRRSSRQRRVRGDNQLHVCSTQTLRQLKLQIMNLLAVPPFDQHLSLLCGIPLDDDKASLGSLHIFPGDTLLLRVQQPLEDAIYLEDCVQDGHTEQGFKGTGLQGR